MKMRKISINGSINGSLILDSKVSVLDIRYEFEIIVYVNFAVDDR